MTRPAPTPEACAAQVVDTTLEILCTIRSQLRAEGQVDITMAQFRTLIRLKTQPGCSLTDLADDIGVSPPAVSKLIDGLVERGLVERSVQADDRRRIGLVVSPAGLRALALLRAAVQARVAARLADLAPEERRTLHDALQRVAAAVAVKEVLA
ncbi:MAG: MarR family winged helix-turn-helix transcriptional regulator [Thermoplasmatota archaeon]|nr:MarR family transcriptional regulator [Halobacteriales archaeon]